MWTTLHRARRRLGGGGTRSAVLAGPSVPASPRPVEDIVIVFARAEIDRLRHALAAALGDQVDEPNSPARIEKAIALLLANAGAPGRAHVVRRPAAIFTPESWENPPRRRGTGIRPRSPRGWAQRTVQLVISTVCLQCGTPSERGRGSFCRRCGLPYGQPPGATADLPSCPVCYRTVDDDGRLPSLDRPGRRVDLVHHQAEHDRHPVGDDEWLETLRTGDRIRVDRWNAPFDTVRRYLVTGQVDAGRNRALAHDAIVTAMTQINRWGPDGDIFGDTPDWKAARSALAALMERFARGRIRN